MFGDSDKEEDVTPTPADEGTENTAAADGGEQQSNAEKAADNKPAEEAALEEAVAAEGGEDVAGDNVEHETSEEVFYNGRKVVRILPADQQTPAIAGFVRCDMSDGTQVDVPRGLFTASDLEAAEAPTEESEE